MKRAAFQIFVAKLRLPSRRSSLKRRSCSAVIGHELERVDAVAAALAHRLAIGAHDRRVDDHVLERQVAHEVLGRHHHAGDPQAHDVTGRREQLRRIGVDELGCLGAVLAPAHGDERPQLRAEPRVEHILVLA